MFTTLSCSWVYIDPILVTVCFSLGSLPSFLGAMLVWGWLEYVFLIGVITGPNTSNCPSNVTNAERFIRAWGTLAYHEIALLIALGSIFYLCWSAENMFGLWTFVILYFARICAKLNLFFGVPRINVNLYRRLYLISQAILNISFKLVFSSISYNPNLRIRLLD